MEDIREIDFVAIEDLKQMIAERRVESAGTLIAYLMCCTEIL
jgi:hypothetical protein